ncbi:magnesium-translocating P-type ATPase [Galbitalea soli]|uniref:Magnesium-transporting ATPase, P-type 1 n=1 Tax=Galbitalea soli TaxID=1268042 RepID=A0A7C9PLI4_9MICO|nr:magnesium-translocating P-type ATPase [Galbitalea soli]NEM90068.1 magnesium-translocating P-type ATPase [Galbitalea soli]NYJ30775.1 Mg2+-importing ATPase [Galbitalea soli]
MRRTGPAAAVDASSGGAPFWSGPEDALLATLATTRSGLAEADVAAVADRFRADALASRAQLPWWRLLVRQFLSPIVLILVAATIISGALGDLADAAIIIVIILLSGLLGFTQEHGAGRAVRALVQSVAVTVTVRRAGVAREIPLGEVVPGDVIELSAGDLVPGDCRILAANGLTVDEAALTGETFPVEKRPGECAPETALEDRGNTVFLGTHVVTGSGLAVVARVGRATEYGRISDRVAARRPPTGFERGLTALGLLLGRIMIVLVVAIFVVNLLLQRPLIDSALFSLALAVGLTPQLLPAIVSISLAQGARQMAKQRVIVRRLDAIEDFGSMGVLCSDKTGTMTVGAVQLAGALSPSGRARADVLELASLNAGLQLGMRNPIDAAIVAAHALPTGVRALAEVPYDFSRRRLSILVESATAAADSGTGPVLITKGAFDSVLGCCSRVRSDGNDVDIAPHRDALHARFAAFSEQGLRVLAMATGRSADAAAATVADEDDLVFRGFLTFADPIKPGADRTIRALQDAGVSVRMLTGDNHLVAAHVARQVGLATDGALTGAEVERLDDAGLRGVIPSVEVFSELTPSQKERVVAAFRAAGTVVGYLGDGINDAPSISAADVGISVSSAVSVAKESAAIVLLEKDLGVLLDGVRQGRRTFANTMKYIFMATSSNFGNMLSMAIGAAVLPFLPLLASQILLLNLLGDLPATTIATDSVDAGQLQRPQRWNVHLIRRYMLAFGALSSVFDLVTFAVLRLGLHAHAAEFRSAWFLGSVLTEVSVIVVLRTRRPFWRSSPARPLLAAGAAVIVAAVTLIYSPLADPFQLIPLPVTLVATIVGIVAAYLASTEVLKHFFWRTPRRRTAPGVV